ncbi:hypothetical protein [Paucibacter soli]|uniref:hypothetical protein n=1 Tax=Paucibacter soli TaxID=3133433 RepID=UPI0030AA4D81
MTQQAQASNLAAQVRDSLVMSERIIVECVNEVLAAQPPHVAELFRRQLKTNKAFAASIMRVTVDVGVVLTLAKCFESDEEFSDSAGLVHDIDLKGHEGAIGIFARAMVECDLKSITKAEAGEMAEDAVLYDLIPTDILERRLRLLLAFMDQVMQRAH